MKYTGSRQLSLAVQRSAWLLGYLVKYGEITTDYALNRIGVPLRTFRRDLDRLREAGHRISSKEAGRKWTYKYRGFDPDYSDLIRRRDQEISGRANVA